MDCPSDYSTFPTVSLLIGGYWFDIPPYTYLVEDDGYCIVGFLENSDDTWLVGDVFLRNYYSVFDDDTGELTFAPRITNTYVTTIEAGTAPSKEFSKWDIPYVKHITYFIIGLVGAGGITVLVLYFTGVIGNRGITVKSKKVDKNTMDYI